MEGGNGGGLAGSTVLDLDGPAIPGNKTWPHLVVRDRGDCGSRYYRNESVYMNQSSVQRFYRWVNQKKCFDDVWESCFLFRLEPSNLVLIQINNCP